MNIPSSLPQARLYMGNRMLVLEHRQEKKHLKEKILNTLDKSSSWTRGEIIDTTANQLMFQARSVSRWGVRLVLEKHFPIG